MRVAPSRTVKHPASRRDGNTGRQSPSPSPTEARAPIGAMLTGWKPKQLAFHKPTASTSASTLAEKTPVKAAAFRQPEEVTDNWDDDFEEGISLSKLRGA